MTFAPQYIAADDAVHLAHPTRRDLCLCGAKRPESSPVSPRILSCPDCYAIIKLARCNICYIERRHAGLSK